MKILLSIKPKYVEMIAMGKKRWEFRKKIPKRLRKGDIVVVYASHPVKRVVGEIVVGKIIWGNVWDVWRLTYKDAGIDYETLYKYTEEVEECYSIGINTYHPYTTPLTLCEAFPNIKMAPPNFCYIENENKQHLIKLLRYDSQGNRIE